MNFPHKELEWTAPDDGAAKAAEVTDQQPLLARAIARQSSSQSARYYFAASEGLPCPLAAAPSSFMDDRMAFFAGRLRLNMTKRKGRTLFETGCFRPDLVHREINEMNG